MTTRGEPSMSDVKVGLYEGRQVSAEELAKIKAGLKTEEVLRESGRDSSGLIIWKKLQILKG